MARPLRIEYPGALYHLMARGNARAAIYKDDQDRQAFSDNLGRVAERCDWCVWAWCLLDNHYHLLIETRQATLARGMREVNGVYSQAFNRRHRRVGHVLQGRYKAVLVERDAYLLELSRYIVLNPVRASLVERAGDWCWSSYRGVMGKAVAPDWLAVDATLALFHSQRGPARRAFARFVAAGIDVDPYRDQTRAGLLGSDGFAEQTMQRIDRDTVRSEHLRSTLPAPSLAHIDGNHTERDSAIRAAYATGAYSLTEIARHFELHVSSVSRIARGLRSAKGKT